MGGFASATVVASTSFLMGILAMHWTADHLLLWQAPVTKESILTAHEYYRSTFSESSTKFQAAMIGIGATGAGTALVKALGGRESNWLFDGASLFLFAAIGLIFQQKIFPNIAQLPPLQPTPNPNPLSAADPLGQSLRELATSNAVIAAALVGIVLLQSGQYYSERLEERERMEELDARIRRRLRKRENEARAAKAAAAAVEAEASSAAPASASSSSAAGAGAAGKSTGTGAGSSSGVQVGGSSAALRST